MKNNILIIILAGLLFPAFSVAQKGEKKKVETIEFNVSGVCGMCEKRIEDAALIKGVKFADWNKSTQKLKVVFLPGKTNQLSIHQAVAKAGHDTNLVKALDEDYQRLNACCKYRDGSEIH